MLFTNEECSISKISNYFFHLLPAILEEKNRSDPAGHSQMEYSDKNKKNRGEKRGIIDYIFVAMVISGAV